MKAAGRIVSGSLFFLALSVGAIGQVSTDSRSGASDPVSAAAYQLLNQRAAANQNAFYVYLDSDSGFNHGVPTGVIGETQLIHVDSNCVDNPSDPVTGCHSSTDATTFDRSRGTVLRITVDPLRPDQSAGVNIWEPSGTYDVSGARYVMFDVRAPKSIYAQFGVGGCVTANTAIAASASYKTMVIDLNEFRNCRPDLKQLKILFGVTVSGSLQAAGGTILLDNIRLLPLPDRQSTDEALSLPLATQTFGVVQQDWDPIPPDQVNHNQATVYESALTMLALLKRGQRTDLANALEIAKALHYALYHDNHRSPVAIGPDLPDGCFDGLTATQCGMHDAYSGGDLKLNSDQAAPAQGKKGDARLAGFSVGQNSLKCGEGRICLIQEGADGGNNAWAMLAFLAAYRHFQDPTYLYDAVTLGNWMVANLLDTSGNSFGGYFTGYKGGETPDVLIRGKSTRNNAEIWAAFSQLAAIEASRGNTSASSYWSQQANAAGDFVVHMFSPVRGSFYAGTTSRNEGTNPCEGPDIEQGDDVVNTCDSVDAATSAILAMAGSARYVAPGFTWDLPMQHVLGKFGQTISADAQVFDGLGPQAPDSPAISWELTGQAAEGCKYLDKVLASTAFQDCAAKYVAQLRSAQSTAPFGDGLGLVGSTLPGGDNLPPSRQCLQSGSQCIPERVSLAATAWAIMAEAGHNPLAYAAPAFAPALLDFSDVRVGSHATRTVTISSSGNAPLTITSRLHIGGTDRSEFAITGGTCAVNVTLAGRATCSIKVTFTPSSTEYRSATLIFSHNGIGSPQSLSLRGSGQSLQVATPTFTPAGGVYTTTQAVVISDATPGATIYYTTDGSTPTQSSPIYSSPIVVSQAVTIHAMAAASGYNNSDVGSSSYSIITGGGGLINYVQGFTLRGLALNGKATLSGSRLRLTDGGAGEKASAWYTTPVNVQAFTQDFSFQLTSAQGDGMAFVIQNAGTSALGSGGEYLGYSPIGTSVAVKFDLYNNAGEGPDSTGLYVQGATPTVPALDMRSSGVNLHSGDVFNVHMSYDGTTLSMTITDATTQQSFSAAWTIDIPGTVGGTTAYVGFTAGTGGATAIQDVLNWSFAAAAPVNYGGGFTSTTGLALNGKATLSGSRLRLTDGGAGEKASAWYTTPVNVQAFTQDFSFQLTSAQGDGMAFVIQNAGTSALGSGGEFLGYSPIGTSIAVKFDLYNNAGEGPDSTGLYVQGATPTVPALDMRSSGVNLHSGDVFNVHMSYDGTTLSMTITDATTQQTFSASWTIDIPGTVGGTTAYVGFTAGTGGATAIQDVLNWSFAGTATVNYLGGFAATTGLALNGKAALDSSRLRLTDGGAGEKASAWYTTPVNVQAFTQDFSFQLTSAQGDGMAFVIQNAGTSALGSGGEYLGYSPIGTSVAVKFDLYNNAGEGPDSTGLYVQGATPTVPALDMRSSGVNLHSGDVFNVHMSYDGTTLSMTITDATTQQSFSAAWTIDIPSTVGGTTAYVGFTAGTGGATAIQDVLNWSFASQSTSAPQRMTLSANKTFLINSYTGVPVFITGDDAFDLAVQISDADVTTYLADRANRGFNAIWIAAVDNTYQSNPPQDYYGDVPFSGADFTNENAAYWSHLDNVIQTASSYGITVFLSPAFAGLNASSGYYASFKNSSQTVLTNYGTFLGNRYKGYDNIVWVIGGDADPTDTALQTALGYVATGIAAADTNHLITAEAARFYENGNPAPNGGWSSVDAWGYVSWLNANWVYNSYSTIQAGCSRNYALGPPFMVPFAGEDWYEGEHSMTSLHCGRSRIGRLYPAASPGASLAITLSGRLVGHTTRWDRRGKASWDRMARSRKAGWAS